jgi:hypothetical protein
VKGTSFKGAPTSTRLTDVVDVGVAVGVDVEVVVGVGDLYSAAAVWLAAAMTVSNQGVAGVSVGITIFKPPATMGVSPGKSVAVVRTVLVEVVVTVGVPLDTTTTDVGLEAGLVFVAPAGPGVPVAVGVHVAVPVDIAVPVLEAVGETVGEYAGLLVCVAVAVAVNVGTGVFVGLGLLILVGFLVGLASAISDDVELSDSAWAGNASRHTNRNTKRIRDNDLIFITDGLYGLDIPCTLQTADRTLEGLLS